jgi:hypothetical protein
MRFKRTVVPLLLPAAVLGAAADAGATLRIEHNLDPAGDPTVVSYRVDGPTWSSGVFPMIDGEYKSFGPNDAGAYTLQALPPAGWAAGDIQCFGRAPSDFTIDVANARVTVQHGPADEHVCAFTHRKVRASGSVPQTPGVAPTARPEELPKVVLPDRPEILSIRPGRRSAAAIVRLVRRTVVKARLQTKGGRVLDAMRIERDAGTYTLRVRLNRKDARRLSRRGRRDEVTLTFRIVMTERGGARRIFRHGVVVEL